VDAPQPGHFWKTPFIWEPGCRRPPELGSLAFEPIDRPWLERALAEVMAHSVDESDIHVVAKYGANRAALDLLAVCPQHFEQLAGWWQAAVDAAGDRVGFTLPVLFRHPAPGKDARPEGTIFYMGVLPQHRGQGFGYALLEQATRTCIAADCWRILCDTSSSNEPMMRAFRKAGYLEREPWQRPLE